MMLFTANSPVKPLYGVNAKPNHMVAYFGNKTLYAPLKRLIMFQRRHYEKIAETLAQLVECPPLVVERMILMFRRDNERFDSQRFIKAFNEHYEFIWGVPYPAFLDHKVRSPHTA